MANATLYPPIVDSYTPAFIGNSESGTCRVYYSVSKVSNIEDVKSIHFSIVKQSSGMSVVNSANKSDGRYGQTGILIINTDNEHIICADADYDNLYYTEINAEDIQGGWTPGWVYKIQVRFSTVKYDGDGSDVAAWLNNNANSFSEWSTYTITKATSEPLISLPVFNGYIGNSESDNIILDEPLDTSILEILGEYHNEDEQEILYSYRLKLQDSMTRKNIEDSGLIYANQYGFNRFYYLFKQELVNGVYDFILEYETLNKYSSSIRITFEVKLVEGDSDAGIGLLTAEDEGMQSYTSIEEEQTDGRVALKLSLTDNAKSDIYTGTIYIRRSDMRTNFSKWEDIITLSFDNDSINDSAIIYDYTVESGVWYKYGVQTVADGKRSKLAITNNAIKREYDYSYLLGENGQQLKLMFDNTLDNIKTTYSESRTDTIGSKFPFITRNGNMKYKTFPVNGLISFNMDENNLFITKKDLYIYDSIVELYNNEPLKNSLYNYTYERDFRNKVLEFLEDGKPKLFKSPTEGNIIIRLMDVSASPNATLSRLTSSFSSNATEIADANIDNYKKYKFLF